MNIFGIFGKRTTSSVTAHILDPKIGYSKQTWRAGEQVPHETVEKFCEDGNIFVIVYYEAGTPKQMICKRDMWNQIKAHFDSVDKASQASMRQIMDELNNLK